MPTTRLTQRDIGGQLRLTRATLTNPDGDALDLDGARIDRGAVLTELTATGKVQALGAHIGGQLDLTGAIIKGAHRERGCSRALGGGVGCGCQVGVEAFR